MNKSLLDYKRYKWFFTQSGKLVIGGKNAEQNEELLNTLKSSQKNYIVMHTAEPGSPFCIILDDIKNITKQDKEECAIFTGCFSRAWRSGKSTAFVHIFEMKQLYKDVREKIGTWKVVGNIDKINVPLKLILTKQKGVLRAIPPSSLKKIEKPLLTIFPGKTQKEKIATAIAILLNGEIKLQEIISSLPSGGARLSTK